MERDAFPGSNEVQKVSTNKNSEEDAENKEAIQPEVKEPENEHTPKAPQDDEIKQVDELLDEADEDSSQEVSFDLDAENEE